MYLLPTLVASRANLLRKELAEARDVAAVGAREPERVREPPREVGDAVLHRRLSVTIDGVQGCASGKQ